MAAPSPVRAAAGERETVWKRRRGRFPSRPGSKTKTSVVLTFLCPMPPLFLPLARSGRQLIAQGPRSLDGTEASTTSPVDFQMQ